MSAELSQSSLSNVQHSTTLAGTDNVALVSTDQNAVTIAEPATFVLPDDGSPITISSTKLRNKGGLPAEAKLAASQTSLLIEYYEAGKTGDKLRTRPSVRVRVTPSHQRKHNIQSDAIQITGIGKDKKPAYSRRISLGNKPERALQSLDGTQISNSSDSARSQMQVPIEVELLDTTHSDLSARISELSAITPDSSVHPAVLLSPSRKRATTKVQQSDLLKAPAQSRARSLSQERIAQRVLKKLSVSSGLPVEYEPEDKPSSRTKRRSSTRSHLRDDLQSRGSSQLSSKVTDSQVSYRSSNSKVSLNNPKLLQVVEDTVRRIILPELQQLRHEKYDELSDSRRSSACRRGSYTDTQLSSVSRAASTPDIRSKPKVVLNRSQNSSGQVLSRGDSIGSNGDVVHKHKDQPIANLKGDENEHRARTSPSGQSPVVDVRNDRNKEYKPPTFLDKSYQPFALGPADSEVTRRSILSSSTEGALSPSSGIYHDAYEYSELSVPSNVQPVPSTIDSMASSTISSTLHDLRTQQSRDLAARGESPTTKVPANVTMRAKRAGVEASGLEDTRIVSPLHETSNHSRGIGKHESTHSLKHKRTTQKSLVPEALRTSTSAQFSTTSSMTPSSVSSSPQPRVPQLSRDKSSYDSSSTDHDHDNGEHVPTPKSSDKFAPKGVDDWFRAGLGRTSRPSSDSDAALAEGRGGNFTSPQAEPTYSLPTTHDGFANRPAVVQESLMIESAVASLLEPSVLSAAQFSYIDASEVSSARYSQVDRTIEANETMPVSPARFVEDRELQSENLGQSTRSEQQEHVRESPMAPIERERLPKHRTSPTLPLQHVQESLDALEANNGSRLAGETTEKVTAKPASPSRSIDRRLLPSRSSPIMMSANAMPRAHDQMPEPDHGLADNESEVDTNPPSIQGPRPDSLHLGSWLDTKFRSKGRTDGLCPVNHVDGHDNVSRGVPTGTTLVDVQHMSSQDFLSTAGSHNAPLDRSPGPHDTQAVEGPSGTADKVPRFSTSTWTEDSFTDMSYSQHAGAGPSHSSKLFKSKLSPRYQADYDAVMGGGDSLRSGAGMRHFSAMTGTSQFDSITSKGGDSIGAKDLSLLVDQLTARDAERHARDTELLVTLVRSASEMRSAFDDMKQFIAEQDRMIMKRTDVDAGWTVQKVLENPRQHSSASAQNLRTAQDDHEYTTKRRNIFARAFKGISSRSANDRERIEEMLERLLDNVESLKEAQSYGQSSVGLPHDDLDDRAMSVPYLGLEKQSMAEHARTHSASGSITPTQGEAVTEIIDTERSGSKHSTQNRSEQQIQEDELAYRVPRKAVANTPLTYRALSNRDRPMELSPEEVEKHKSQVSSLLTSGPTLSRWSKTTASSGAAEGYDSRRQSQEQQANSPRRSDGSLQAGEDKFKDARMSLSDKDQHSLRSIRQASTPVQTLPVNEDRSPRSPRSAHKAGDKIPSPMLPISTSSSPREKTPNAASVHSASSRTFSVTPSSITHLDEKREADVPQVQDPKYQAYRTSLPLQHPQPRQGSTGRHQSALETQAHMFEDDKETSSEVSSRSSTSNTSDALLYGSMPAINLAKSNIISEAVTNRAYVSLPHRAIEPNTSRTRAPHVPRYAPELATPVQQMSNQPMQHFGRTYYNSPLGEGHLLEPIEEVRYSLETDVCAHRCCQS